MAGTSSTPPADDFDEDEGAQSGAFPIAREFVCTIFNDRDAAPGVERALNEAGFVAAGPDVLSEAWTVLAEIESDIEHAIARLRGRMRPDAALIAVVPDRADIGPALRAGAIACLRTPIVVEQVVAAVRAATETRLARLELADLSRQLDLQTHLASIGRVSAGLAHEIGSPLAVIALALETLEHEIDALSTACQTVGSVLSLQDDPEALRRLRTTGASMLARARSEDARAAIAEGKVSLARVNDLMLLMKQLVGWRAATLQRTELRDLVERVCRWLMGDALAGVQVEKLYEAEVAALAHPRLVEQVLVNLIENAARAARSLGSPHVRVRVYRRRSEAVISVRDNGPGIRPEDQPHVFEPFFTTHRGQGGTGLGLALCREYAGQMGAHISLWSVVGRGACFRVHLRLASS